MKKRSIRKKFLYGYLLIFSVSLILLNVVISNMLDQNSENIIKTDMKTIQKYSREYMKQYIFLNNLNNDAFVKTGGTLAQELSQNLKTNIALYDQNGIFLYEAIGEGKEYVIVNSNPSPIFKNSRNKDLQKARNNTSSFTINQINDETIVNFSYPLHINGEFFGIVRVSKNYQPMFQSNQIVLISLTLFTLFLFFVIFLFSYVLSNKITKPLLNVTQAFTDVAQGKFDTTLTVKTGDEIEELTEHFHEMKKKIKEQIVTIQEEKEKIEKLERSRREFFNNVTHELKTPLTTISGYAQILSDEEFDDHVFLHKAAGRIKTESDRLHAMVVEIIELSKRSSREKKKVDFTKIIVQHCEDMRLKASQYGMKIDCHLSAVTVNGDEGKLSEVIINLLDNAIKYGINDSTIRVVLSLYGEELTLEISNSCQNFNKDVLTNAFEPFYRGSKTTKDEKGSIGLGLYISKQIIEEHQGSISMRESNSLVTFFINLPIWQQLGNN